MLHLYIGSIYQQCTVKDYLKLNEMLFITDVTPNNVHSSRIPAETVIANKEDVARSHQTAGYAEFFICHKSCTCHTSINARLSSSY